MKHFYWLQQEIFQIILNYIRHIVAFLSTHVTFRAHTTRTEKFRLYSSIVQDSVHS